MGDIVVHACYEPHKTREKVSEAFVGEMEEASYYTHQGLLTTLISADEVIWLRAAIRRLLKSADENFLMELKGTLFQTCHSQTRKEEGEM